MVLDDVRTAVSRLSRTKKGSSALRHILAWLDDDGLALDQGNKAAVLTVLQGAWGAWPGTVRELIQGVVESRCEHEIRDGEWCEQCNKAYKEAAREAESQ